MPQQISEGCVRSRTGSTVRMLRKQPCLHMRPCPMYPALAGMRAYTRTAHTHCGVRTHMCTLVRCRCTRCVRSFFKITIPDCRGLLTRMQPSIAQGHGQGHQGGACVHWQQWRKHHRVADVPERHQGWPRIRRGLWRALRQVWTAKDVQKSNRLQSGKLPQRQMRRRPRNIQCARKYVQANQA